MPNADDERMTGRIARIQFIRSLRERMAAPVPRLKDLPPAVNLPKDARRAHKRMQLFREEDC
jgi:hypothetical protein